MNHLAQRHIAPFCSSKPETSQTISNPAASLEALLRDACRRALGVGLSFTNQRHLYSRPRSGSAAALWQQRDPLPALLAAVCERASELGSDPELPLPDAILAQRLAVRLSLAARHAGGSEPAQQPFFTKDPIQRETETPDDRFSAWHKDHMTDRDRRAYEKLRSMLDERAEAA